MAAQTKHQALKTLTYRLFKWLLRHPRYAVPFDQAAKNAAWRAPEVQGAVKAYVARVGEAEALLRFSEAFDRVAATVRDRVGAAVSVGVPDEGEVSMAVLLPDDVQAPAEEDAEWMNAQPPSMGFFNFGGTF